MAYRAIHFRYPLSYLTHSNPSQCSITNAALLCFHGLVLGWNFACKSATSTQIVAHLDGYNGQFVNEPNRRQRIGLSPLPGLYSISNANDLSTPAILTRELINVTLTRDISCQISNAIPLIRIDRYLLPLFECFGIFSEIEYVFSFVNA